MKNHLLTLLVLTGFWTPVFSQLTISSTATAFTIDFDNTVSDVNNGQFLAPNPFAVETPVVGELDRDAIQVSETQGTAFNWPATLVDGPDGEGISNGGVGGGGVYAFSSDGGSTRFLGVQPTSGQYTPGALILRAQNSTGQIVDGLTIAYVGMGNSNTSNDMQADVYYSLDGSSWSQLGPLSFQTAAPSGWTSSSLSGSASGLSISDAAFFYVKWVFSELGGGTRSEIGIDDISITLNVGAACTGSPSLASSNLSFTATDETSTTLSWTNGDGSNRIVVAKENTAISSSPTDNSTYTGNSTFGSGDDIGTGEYVVYNGNANSTVISGLTPGRIYHVTIFEYNCAAGNESYLLPGTSISETTIPEDVQNLNDVCGSNTTVELSWGLPIGDYDGVMVFARDGATPTQPLVDASDATLSMPNADYSATADIGNSGRLLYEGTETSLTVTGLPTSNTLTFKVFTYRFNTSTIWSDGTQTDVTIELNEISNFATLPADQQLDVTWDNPASLSCIDEILIIGRQGSAVSSTPMGNGSSYVANSIFGSGTELNTGEFVVYKGMGASVSVTGLTNGNTYHFKAFIRDGTEWSTGIDVSGIPADVTVLNPGDVAIIALNTNLGNGVDEICFFAFEDIAPGTAIDFTDNGYERENAGLWGDTEGTIRMTWNGASPLATGTVICIQGNGNSSSDFDIYTCGVLDTDWIISSLNGSSNFDLNDADEIYIMQNGTWDNPFGTHNADYTGNILYGWTATGWGVGTGTALSNLYPNLDCFNTDVTGLSNNDKVKYTGLITSATRLEWLGRINDPSNWTGYGSNGDYNTGGYDFTLPANCPLAISSGTATAGQWIGTEDDNWFNCSNWEDLTVPDASTSVMIDATASNPVRIDAGATFSDNFGDVATCADLTIDGLSLQIEDADDVLEVNGNLAITGTGLLDMDGSSSTDGTLRIAGNWSNTVGSISSFSQGQSTIEFTGTTQQTLQNTETFGNVEINNGAGVLLNAEMNIAESLTFSNGDISAASGGGGPDGGTIKTETAVLTFLPGSSTSGASDVSHATGIVAFQGSGSFSYPIGDGAALHVLEAIGISGNLGSITDEFRAEYFSLNPKTEVGNSVASNVGFISPQEYWILDRIEGSSTPKQILLTYRNPNSGIMDISAAYVVRWNGTLWEQAGGNGNLSNVEDVPNNSGTITSANVNDFSPFTFADNGLSFPVELSSFSAELIKGEVVLDWRTESETNNAFFSIERSNDATLFEEIGQVIGQGTSAIPHQYSFSDHSPQVGFNYYRLKQVDFNGQFSYSQVIAIQVTGRRELELVRAYPNPVLETLFLEVLVPEASPLSIHVLSTDGKIVWNKEYQDNLGKLRIAIDIDELSSGLYLIQGWSGNNRFTHKFVVEK